jgi:hypothetical protein
LNPVVYSWELTALLQMIHEYRNAGNALSNYVTCSLLLFDNVGIV